jgi:hypothetical protein
MPSTEELPFLTCSSATERAGPRSELAEPAASEDCGGPTRVAAAPASELAPSRSGPGSCCAASAGGRYRGSGTGAGAHVEGGREVWVPGIKGVAWPSE